MFGVNRDECDKELVVGGASIKEKSTNDALDAIDAGFIKKRAGVCFSIVLDLGAVCDFGVLVR